MADIIFKRGLEENLPTEFVDGQILITTDSGKMYIDSNDDRLQIGGSGSNIGQSTAEGGEIFNDYEKNQATGAYSSASGADNKAAGACAFVIGNGCRAQGKNSFAAGYKCWANGNNSAAIGNQIVADGMGQISLGQHNITNQNDIFQIGVGFYTEDTGAIKRNSLTIDKTTGLATFHLGAETIMVDNGNGTNENEIVNKRYTNSAMDSAITAANGYTDSIIDDINTLLTDLIKGK